jgi:nucleotide-binding universal stress UspA family protein
VAHDHNATKPTKVRIRFMNQIIVGVDGSAGTEPALVWAGHVASALRCEVTAVNAFVRPWAQSNPEDHDRLLAERRNTMRGEWIGVAVEQGANVRTMVREGDPRDVLATASKGADLVVLGRRGSGSGPGFLHLGSVVEHAAHHSEAPLAVIPGESGPTTKSIVIGVDGSPGSASAVRWCVEVAPALGASVLAVGVDDPVVEWTTSQDPKNWRQDLERRIEEWTAPLRAAGVPVESVVAQNERPADALLGEASDRHADLVVIGTRGTGGFSGLRMGGITMKVLHQATLPIVMVPPDGVESAPDRP